MKLFGIGVQDYLEKPVEPDQLIDAVKKALTIPFVRISDDKLSNALELINKCKQNINNYEQEHQNSIDNHQKNLFNLLSENLTIINKLLSKSSE